MISGVHTFPNRSTTFDETTNSRVEVAGNRHDTHDKE